jgi:hypothetical protein
LVAELASLAEAAEKRLSLASADAQMEWQAARSRWPSQVELREGVVALSDDELAVMRSKVKRFVSILGAAVSAQPANAEIRAVDRRTAADLRLDFAPSGATGRPRRRDRPRNVGESVCRYCRHLISAAPGRLG